ncbi:MAG: YcjF family protein [Pirellulales bacterium]
MSIQSQFSRFWLIITLAVIGAALIYLPSTVASYYQQAENMQGLWKYVYLTSISIGGALILGTIITVVWKLYRAKVRKNERKVRRQQNPSQLSSDQKQTELNENIESISELEHDINDPELNQELGMLVDKLQLKLNQQRLEIVVFGTISSGKSSLLNALAGRDAFTSNIAGGTTVTRNEIELPVENHITLVDTPGLGEVDGASRQEISADAAQSADIILLVVDGPLRESEFQLLELLGGMEKRVIVCLNKEDCYTDEDRSKLLNQLTQQVAKWLESEDLVVVRSQPTTRNRMRVLPDGEHLEESVELPISIEPLALRMQQIVRQDGTDLLLANLLLQSRGLVEQAKDKVEQSLDRRANQIIDKYMWGAGGAAAVSPFPLVDLAAGCAISTKMVVDLATVYRQEVDLDVAVNLLGQFGKSLLAILGVSIATPVITSIVASLLKTVPGAGTIAGGALQGLVVALVTRWIGNVFMIYFKNEMQEPEGGLAGLAQREWKRVTQLDYLRKLVQQARQKHVDN